MTILENLLIIYASVLFINLIISAILWKYGKTPMYRSVFFLWLASIASFVINGLLVKNDLLIVLGFSSAFLINIALVYLLKLADPIRIPMKLYTGLIFVGLVLAIIGYLLELDFYQIALPVTLTVSFPALYTPLTMLIKRWGYLSISTKALAIITICLGLHNIDFAFLRNVESFASIGFSIALILIFCLSIFAPAIVLEKMAEQQSILKEMDRLKSNFFANISHELRTPLTLILSPISSLLEKNCQEIDQSFLENVHRNASRLHELINDLLDLSKLEAGRMGMKVRHVDLIKLIRYYIGMVHSAFEAKKIKLDFVSLNDSVFLYLDVEKMNKVGLNILSNALKFTNGGGEVIIKIRDDEKACMIDFVDSGIGIPTEKLDSIFDRFSQVDSELHNHQEGTGIGLSLVKEYIEMHGGKISVKSRFAKDNPHDHGTTFSITIPKGKMHFENSEAIEFINDKFEVEKTPNGEFEFQNNSFFDDAYENVSHEPDTSFDNHLLVVDDNPDMRNFLRGLLQKKYNVSLAVDGKDGIQQAKDLKPDIIITDVMMPIMNGYEMTQQIKADPVLKRIPVLMLTAKAGLMHKIEGLEYGADEYLVKPFNARELIARIESLLRLKSVQDQLYELNKQLSDKVEDQVKTIRKTDELKRYLAPQLVNAVLNGDKKLNFDVDRRKLTIFFSDIKDFSGMTDTMEPEEVSAILNDYISEMSMIANKWGGTIDKFIGDAIMIFFGAPETKSDKKNALSCVKMALEMQCRLKKLRERWFAMGFDHPLEIRIGINTGIATVGNFAAGNRLYYTAIGTQVNLASRLQELANAGGVLISHSTRGLISNELIVKKRGSLKVRGISKEVLCYDVVK